jgi:hypothetical protein
MTDELLLELVRKGIAQNEQILKEQTAAREALNTHMVEEEILIKGLVAAFPKKPDGSPDFDGHEVFHSTLIEESRARTTMYRELRHDLIKKGFWGLIGVLTALVVYWWNGHIKP